MEVRFASGKTCFCVLWATALLLFSTFSYGYRFERLTLTGEIIGKNDNISAVRATIKDHLGFVWFGGENGLGRYDGQELIIYQTDSGNPRSISANFIWALAIDHDGVIWIGTGRGLNRYNAKTDDFDHFLADPNNPNSISNNNVNRLTVDKDNNLIIATSNGLSILNPERTQFQNFYYNPASTTGPNSNFVREIFIDQQERIWLGTRDDGLQLFKRDTGEFVAFKHDPDDQQSLIGNDVAAIADDHNGYLWVGTYNNGLSRMNPDSKTFEHYKYNAADPNSLGSNVVSDILHDSENKIWVSTDHGGLNLYQPETNSFQRFKYSPYDLNSLASDNPRHLFEDEQGNLWIGMFPTGVTFLDRSASIFTNYSHKPDDINSLSNGSILCFFEDSEGILWIGTENGLNAFDQKKNKITRYFHGNADQKNRHSFQAILSIAEDITGELWIGTWSGGLHRFNKETGAVHTYFPDPDKHDGINNAFIWEILRDKDDTLWLATETGGLNRYNRETDSFTHFTADPKKPDAIISNQVWTVMEDSRGYIWVATLEGLDRFDKNINTFTHYLHDPNNPDSISSNQIISLMEDSKGKIWIGTRDTGLSILDATSGKFSHLNVRDGLPSPTISSIIEDDSGVVWVTTVNGLARIEPESMAITSFNRSDGLISNNFNRDATFKDKQGKLYAGSIAGFSVFNPSDIKRNSNPPPVVITDFRILNHPVSINDANGILKQAITETKQLTLNYKHTMFSFDFAALSFRAPTNNRYAYKLEGFDADWHYIGNQSSATYTNINPGHYIFRVKAANRDGVWNEEGASIVIEIIPPVWRTWWAYLCYALLIIAIFYMLNIYKNLRIKTDIYKALSTTDHLTGTYNRAGIQQLADELFNKQDAQTKIGLLVMDLDHFKSINDIHGHDVGDRVLRDFTQRVANNIRAGDIFGRWGGEEFVLLSSHRNREGVIAMAEKLCAVIAETPFEQEHSPLAITVSIGVACAEPKQTFEQVFKDADTALYKAKASGRNRVVVFESARGREG